MKKLIIILFLYFILCYYFIIINKENFKNREINNIIILCGGPPKHNRDRHLEINKYNNKIIISDIINKCKVKDTTLYIVIYKDNKKLIKFIKKNHKFVKILLTKTLKMLNTFEIAFSIPGNTIIVLGDLLNLKYGDINKFVDSKIKSIVCKYKIPWGQDINNNNIVIKANIGTPVLKIHKDHKKKFLSKNNIIIAKKYFNKCYPKKIWNDNINNHLYTWLVYTFFINQFTNTMYNKKNLDFDKGFIKFEHTIYDDND